MTTPATNPETGFDAHDSASVATNANTLAQKYVFAAQYIDTGATADGPAATAQQIQTEQAAGLKTVSIFQTNGMTSNPYYGGSVHYESYLTEAQGKADAAQAFADAAALGQPAGSAIYFAMDFDPGQSANGYSSAYTEQTTLTNVQNYFKGINDYIANLPPGSTIYKIGVYGAGDTISAVMKNTTALYGDPANSFTNPNYTPNPQNVQYSWLTQSSAWAGSGQGNVNSQGLTLYQQDTDYSTTPAIDPDQASTTDVGDWTALCFVTGTAIRTLRGDVPVEALAAGDFAVTAAGALRPVAWVGHRTVVCTDNAKPSASWPVRIRAHAFGADLPERDLYLSPGHPILVGEGEDEVLVPIMCLINGTSIARIPVDRVTYWHVELDEHDILLAEGLPAESYLEFGSRPWFANAEEHLLNHPDFIAPGLNGRCRPVAIDGPFVEAERQRLDAAFATDLAAQCAWPSHEGLTLDR